MTFKRIGITALLAVLVTLFMVLPLDGYVSQPGGAYELSPLVHVEDGDEEDTGTFSLMTISVGKATPATYLWSHLSDKMKLLPADKVRRHGEDDREYNIRQLRLMSDSQFNAITVAFEKAGKPVEIDFAGIYVQLVVDGSASDGKLEAGDRITGVDGKRLTEPDQFAAYVTDQRKGDTIEVEGAREGKPFKEEITLKEIPGAKGKVGLGIQYQEDRSLKTIPKVTFNTSDIGGPSAGLMFTLEIINQLDSRDITKGYTIAGTGEMLPGGTVGRIGGIDFKVMAADRDGMEIFFAPDDELPEEVKAANPGIRSNYEEAAETAEKIGTTMKIVPVKTVDDALKYLDGLEPKK
ncbi:SepM family pheromone-processing serine protease [Sporosarcina trichiuri]|nr:SepM family pheromone-processing serine protease [Sporosarcina sp. 0.2-SM1T-5]WJY28992.1 SepM family pheromone-processing serine protease [Sporosarcina sp. 0.2-SM1T-5]